MPREIAGQPDDLPEPLTPADCDLRDFGRMMIDITRLFGSTFNAKASRNPLAWMLGHKLWYKSWHQVPAASLPDDDDDLCYLAELGFDRVTWDSARELAMHGWIRCSDGRLYHPVVAEEALEAWQRKLRKRHATLCAAVRKHNERHPEDKIEAPNFEEWQRLNRPERVTDMSRVTTGKVSRGSHAKNRSKGQGQGQGQGQGHSITTPDGDGGAAAAAVKDYAFAGTTIRLNAADLANWRKTYSAIPDLEAELTSLDAWFQTDAGAAKRGSWFHTTAGALNRRHQDNLAAAKKQSAGWVLPGGGTPLSSPC